MNISPCVNPLVVAITSERSTWSLAGWDPLARPRPVTEATRRGSAGVALKALGALGGLARLRIDVGSDHQDPPESSRPAYSSALMGV